MLAAAASALLLVGYAEAHARVKESTPTKAEVLSSPPPQVSITFTQAVQKVTGTYGIEVKFAPTNPRTGIRIENVTSAPATLDDADRTIMTVALLSDLGEGRYEVLWKNVSDADGDPAEGAFSFYLGVEPTAEDLAADKQLALIGEEETPPATEAASTPSPGDTPVASATALAPSSGDDDGGRGDGLIVLGVIVVVGIVVGFIAARFVTRRRTG